MTEQKTVRYNASSAFSIRNMINEITYEKERNGFRVVAQTLIPGVSDLPQSILVTYEREIKENKTQYTL